MSSLRLTSKPASLLSKRMRAPLAADSAAGGFFALYAVLGFSSTKIFVALFNLGRGFGLQAAEGLQEFGGVERLKLEVRPGTVFETRRFNNDDRQRGMKRFHPFDHFGAGDVLNASVENNATDRWKS